MNANPNYGIKVFDIGCEPENFKPEYLYEEKINGGWLKIDEIWFQTWRAEIYYDIDDDEEFSKVMNYYGYDEHLAVHYVQNQDKTHGNIKNILTFCKNKCEPLKGFIYTMDFVFPEDDDWDIDSMYAYVVCTVSAREHFFLSFTCDQEPPSRKARWLIYDHINSLYNPCY